MPEGPEIHRVADTLRDAIGGQEAVEVFFAFDRLSRFQHELAGRTILSVEARGKGLLVRFEGGLNVYSHNQLYGRWMVRKRGNIPKTNRQLRVALYTMKKTAFLYSASDIEVLSDEDLCHQPYLAKLGPDPLAATTEHQEVIDRFFDPRFARRQLASLLLDQGFIGGIGNYLRSEILWQAGVHPQKRPKDLDDSRRQALGEATVELMERSYQTGGITNTPEAVEQMKAQGRQRREYRHFVFSRERQPCPQCDHEIVREMHSGRRVYLCPRCQPISGDGF